jgi:hypothetical protein
MEPSDCRNDVRCEDRIFKATIATLATGWPAKNRTIMAPGSGVVDEEGGECACDEDDRRQQHEGARHAPVVEQPEET